MMKRVLSIMLAVVLALGIAVVSCAEDGYLGELTVINCQNWVSLRAYPDKNSERLAYIPLGASVEAYYCNSEFTECFYDGQWGYVLSTYLSNAFGGGTSAGENEYLGERTIVNCNEFVTLRSKPNKTASAVTRVARGQKVNCYRYDDEFALCYYNGLRGYILTTYISGMDSGSSAGGSTGNANHGTAIHRGDSVVNSLMDEVNFYDYYPGFETYSSPANGRYVNDDGTWTWATFFNACIGLDFEVTNCREFVSLRGEASTGSVRLRYVPLGAEVLVYGEYGDWMMCYYDGDVGWILKDYLVCTDSSGYPSLYN